MPGISGQRAAPAPDLERLHSKKTGSSPSSTKSLALVHQGVGMRWWCDGSCMWGWKGKQCSLPSATPMCFDSKQVCPLAPLILLILILTNPVSILALCESAREKTWGLNDDNGASSILLTAIPCHEDWWMGWGKDWKMLGNNATKPNQLVNGGPWSGLSWWWCCCFVLLCGSSQWMELEGEAYLFVNQKRFHIPAHVRWAATVSHANMGRHAQCGIGLGKMSAIKITRKDKCRNIRDLIS